MKRVNIFQLSNLYEKIGSAKVTSQKEFKYRDISIRFPTSKSSGTSKKKVSEKVNDINDITIHNKDGVNLETIKIGEMLSIYNINNINEIFYHIIENVKGNITKDIQFYDKENMKISFTIPKFCDKLKKLMPDKNKEVKPLLLQLIMIGVNDNGRYRGYNGYDTGFINHMATALSAVHLFHNYGYKEMNKLLNNKGINDHDTFHLFLYGNERLKKSSGIIRYNEIKQFIQPCLL